MRDYFYPDIKDKLTIAFINKHEPYQGYWGKSEQFVLGIIKDHIRKNINNDGASLLDAGCGEGRLLVQFQEFFDKILAIEPDKERLNIANDLVMSSDFSKRVNFSKSSIEQLDESNKFDTILCAHVIQHVSTANIPFIFRKFKSLLKPQGLLVILTCHSKKKRNFFTKEHRENTMLIEKRVSESEFNSLIKNTQGILPHQYFSMEYLKSALKRLNLKVLDIKIFHILNKLYGLDHFINRDYVFNTLPIIKSRFGKDIMIIAQNEN